MATIKEIAQLAGVSRGTVDRVLNHRGAVNPETARKVKEIARAVNYSPNLAGKTLAVTKKALRFGFILFTGSTGNPFFAQVVHGIESRAQQLAEYNASVEVRYAALDDVALQVALIDELAASGIDGLAITPINHDDVRERLRRLTDAGVPVVTVNSDLGSCGRFAYVGSDYGKSGETAAGLLHLACAGEARVGVLIGSPWVLCHSERVAGFTARIEQAYPGITVADTAVNNDDDIESYAVTRAMLEKHPEINALYLASAGIEGACRAVEALGLAGRLKIVCYDLTPATARLIEKGTILATITQQPFTQGAKPLDLLLDYVGMGVAPENEHYLTNIEIKIQENI